MKNTQMISTRYQKAFTLIEVLIAMLIITISITALMQSISNSLLTRAKLEYKIKSYWIAHQTFAMIELGLIPIKTQEDTTESIMLWNERWYTRVHALKQPTPTLQPLSIRVSRNQNGPFNNEIIVFRYLKTNPLLGST